MFSEAEYHTRPDASSWLLRNRFPGKSIVFYLYLARRMLAARAQARRGAFDAATFIRGAVCLIRDIELCGGVFHVTGLDHLRASADPVVFVANHMSMLETFLLPAMVLPVKPLCFVVKKSLLTHRVFGPIMVSQDPIAVSRANVREDLRTVLEEGSQRLAAGTSVCVFPQRTRAARFVEVHFNSLAAKLAARAGVPLVPVALKTDFWGNGRLFKDFGPVDSRKELFFEFGTAAPAAAGSKEAHRRVLEFLRSRLQCWGVPCDAE